MRVPPKRVGTCAQHVRIQTTKIGANRSSKQISCATVMAARDIGSWNGVVTMVSSKSGRRIVALWFPRLATDRLQRRWKALAAHETSESPEAASDAPPLVVAAKDGNVMRVSALDR